MSDRNIPAQDTIVAGRYRVDRILGSSGMGVVVAANDITLDRQVALKFLLPHVLANPDAVRRFARDARAAGRIKSEHVTRILDVGTTETGAPFIAMELLEGEDLGSRLLRTGPLSISDAVALILEACEAIAEAHSLGMVHRDIKPGNLFCAQESSGRVSIKVMGFGLSIFTIEHENADSASPTWVGRTPVYMAPEQVRADRVADTRTDIWSLGVVLYELLSGRPPFRGRTLPDLSIQILTASPPSLSADTEIPRGLEKAILRCLEKDPKERFASVAEFATAIAPYGRATPTTGRELRNSIWSPSGRLVAALAMLRIRRRRSSDN